MIKHFCPNCSMELKDPKGLSLWLDCYNKKCCVHIKRDDDNPDLSSQYILKSNQEWIIYADYKHYGYLGRHSYLYRRGLNIDNLIIPVIIPLDLNQEFKPQIPIIFHKLLKIKAFS